MATCRQCGFTRTDANAAGEVCNLCHLRRPLLVLVPKRSRDLSSEIRPFVIAGFVFFLLLVGSRLAVGYYAAEHQANGVKALAVEELSLHR
jgi:hypothetical protein